ncbi:accessory factor associated with RNA polymerase II [Savitreella phatthalungensis]
MSSALAALREAVLADRPLQLLDESNGVVDDVSSAAFVSTGTGTNLPLDQETELGATRTLRACVLSWLQRNLGTAEYIALANAKGIANLTFIERTTLTDYLSGKRADVGGDSITGVDTAAKSAQQASAEEFLAKIKAIEHTTHPFSFCLHGRKHIDFSSVGRDARDFFLTGKRGPAAGPGAVAGAAGSAAAPPEKRRLRDPIILLSPSASALVTMHNVKKLLEEGVYVPSELAAREAGGPAPEVLSLSYKSKLRPNMTLRFVVVENTDKFKPDYWDRLLVVFTTGQSWQFKPYAHGYAEPRQLFQRVRGVLVRYADEQPLSAEKDWNVQTIKVERNRRHMDKVTVGQFWDGVERWMEQHNKGDFYRHERR